MDGNQSIAFFLSSKSMFKIRPLMDGNHLNKKKDIIGNWFKIRPLMDGNM